MFFFCLKNIIQIVKKVSLKISYTLFYSIITVFFYFNFYCTIRYCIYIVKLKKEIYFWNVAKYLLQINTDKQF